MSFGKFTVKQIIQNCSYGMFCFEVLNKRDYRRLRQAAVSVDSELVRKWDVAIAKTNFPHYLNKSGQTMTKLYALQRDYFVVTIDDIEWNLDEDVCTLMMKKFNTLSDHRKAKVYELVEKFAQEESVDTYYFLTDEGHIETGKVSNNVTLAKDRQLLGNYFTTREAANFDYHKKLNVAKWELIHSKLEKGKRLGVRYYFPCYDEVLHHVIPNCSEQMRYGTLIFSSSENCKSAIEQLGETNVKTYILGVMEDAN